MKNLLLAICLMVGVATQAEAKQYPELTQFVIEKTTAAREALTPFEGEGPFLLAPQFDLKRFLLRIQMKIGFDVEFGKIEVIPELELVFQKEKVPAVT